VPFELALVNAVNGVVLGSIYATIAMGMSLIFGVMGIKNLAHGDFAMLGMFTSFWLWSLFSVDPLISIPVAFALFFILGMAITKFIFKHIVGEMMGSIILTFGLSIFIENVAQAVWGGDYRWIPVSYGVYKLGPLSMDGKYLVAFSLTIALIVLTQLFLTKTKVGIAIRAVTQDPEAAESLGINVDRIRLVGGGLGIALAGCGGAILALIFYIYPYVGILLTLYALIITVLGGLGNVLGAFFGGLIIGIAQSVATIQVPSALAPAVGFAIFVLVLLFRPQGLFGKR
jgi:branched-chain amino acid transport system permease protein